MKHCGKLEVWKLEEEVVQEPPVKLGPGYSGTYPTHMCQRPQRSGPCSSGTHPATA